MDRSFFCGLKVYELRPNHVNIKSIKYLPFPLTRLPKTASFAYESFTRRPLYPSPSHFRSFVLLGANAAALGRSNGYERARSEMGGGWVRRRVPAVLFAHGPIPGGTFGVGAPHQSSTYPGAGSGDQYPVAGIAHHFARPD